MTQSLNVGCLIVNAVGGSIGQGFQREVETFVRTNGLEWTSERLKAVFTAALHLRNGDKEAAIEIYRSKSIAYRPDGTPKGHIGSAVRVFQSAQKPWVVRRWAGILRFYTGIILPTPTRAQLSKSVANITDPSTETKLGTRTKKLMLAELDKLMQGKRYKNYLRERGDFSLLRPPAQNLKGSVSYYSPKGIPSQLKKDPNGQYYLRFTHSILTNLVVPPSLLKYQKLGTEQVRLIENFMSNDYRIGKITLLQEGGAKARVVAQPCAWVQLTMEPLDRLARDLNQVFFPETCVRDQLAGVKAISYAMTNWIPVISVDLSSATDRFPRDVQCDMLRLLGFPQYAEALEFCSSGKWSYPDAQMDVSYSVGQPMGLKGSFPLFNMANCLLARAALQYTRKKGPLTFDSLPDDIKKNLKVPFRVLGDDIVFFDPGVADSYKRMVKSLGVDTSKDKSFESNLAQFAGFTWIRNVETSEVTSFRPYKFPKEGFITNPIEFLNAFGSKVTNLRRYQNWHKALVEFRETIPERDVDLSPKLPADPFPDPAAPVDERWYGSLITKLTMSIPDAYSPEVLDSLMTDHLRHLGKLPPEHGIPPLFRHHRFDEIKSRSIPDMVREEREKSQPERVRTSRALSRDPLIKEVRDPKYLEQKPSFAERMAQARKAAAEHNALVKKTQPNRSRKDRDNR
jgi:hypothetical protein